MRDKESQSLFPIKYKAFVRQFNDIKPQGHDYIYRSCKNCGTVDIVPTRAENRLGKIGELCLFYYNGEVRECTGCNYVWVWT